MLESRKLHYFSTIQRIIYLEEKLIESYIENKYDNGFLCTYTLLIIYKKKTKEKIILNVTLLTLPLNKRMGIVILFYIYILFIIYQNN